VFNLFLDIVELGLVKLDMPAGEDDTMFARRLFASSI
jgi:hypothetical protein